MKNNKDIIHLSQHYLTPNYGRFPVALVRGKGMHVWDKSGKKYLDFVAGIAVDGLGHCHPKVVEAIRRQAGRLMHVSNLYHIEPQTLLARELTQNSFGDKVFFCNSGTEANEAAIKLARRYFFDRGQKNKYEIITMHRAFHGRTLGALSATPQKKMQQGFGPMVRGFKHVPFNDLPALKKAISAKTCAIMVEPIQGETGVILPDDKYLKGIRKLCNDKKILLILDEIQTGFGRTGDLFAYEGFGAKPDIMTLAKGLGGGFPIGALVTRNTIAKSLTPGTHGSTFGGNPLACATSLAVMGVIARKSFLAKVKKTGDYFLKRLTQLAEQFSIITAVRGRGLILAMDMDGSSLAVAQDCLDQGILVNSIQPGTLRFVPPLIVTQKDIDALMRALAKSLKRVQDAR